MTLGAADLEKAVRGLKQALAEQRRVSEKAQTSANTSQQQAQQAHSLAEQLRKALQAKDTELAAVKVLWHVPYFC